MTELSTWQFRRMHAGEMNIDPIEAEFFSTEALSSLTDALVREAIQNSLDARQQDSVARVRMTFPRPDQMLRGERRDCYVKALWPHLLADRSGLAQTPSPDEPLSFLVFEDFGTRGLQGDPSQSEDEEIGSSSMRNDFYYFWRNVGRSKKESSDLGRWGLGKTVFPASSRVNAFFALTVRREDGLRLLMGQAVLRIHKLNGIRYYPYGYFARFRDDFALPIEDHGFVDQFCDDFRVTRNREPGLSVVIPFPDSELAPDAIVPSIVRHYFVPILAGDLVVELVYEGNSEVLDSVSLPRLLERIGWDKAHQLQHLAELAHWGLQLPADQRTCLSRPTASSAPRWSDEVITDDTAEPVREAFNRGERIAVAVPVWVKPTGGSEVLSSFDVYLERDDSLSSGDDHFIREGITVAGVRCGLQAGVRAIVYVRDRSLSALLGDSENPAHTEWQERSVHFKRPIPARCIYLALREERSARDRSHPHAAGGRTRFYAAASHLRERDSDRRGGQAAHQIPESTCRDGCKERCRCRRYRRG